MPAWEVTGITAGVFEIVWPIVAAVVAQRRLRVSWRFFGYGVLVFVIFQIATRIPIIQIVQVNLAGRLASDPVALWTWLTLLALSAGVFEEVGRYMGYRLLFRPEQRTWDSAILYGIGHGSVESILLVGVGTLVTIVGLSSLAAGGLEVLPADQRDVLSRQLSAVESQPIWVWALGAWERVCALVIQVCLSVMVLQVFVRAQGRERLGWLGLAILAHALVDGVAVAIPQVLQDQKAAAAVITEGALTIMAVAAAWIGWRLRRRPAQTSALDAT